MAMVPGGRQRILASTPILVPIGEPLMSVVPEKTKSPRVHPNFVIAGAPTCGTTSLATYLGAHPNVFMTAPKEPNFFCEDLPNTREIRTADGYRALFDKVRSENKHRVPGGDEVTSLSANVRETRTTQRIRVGRRQRNGICWDCEREWKRMVVPLDPARPSEARQPLRTRRS